MNDRMETSAPDIYAVGDAVQVKHFVTGQDTLLSLAGPANKQGRIAADNICGGDSRYPGSQGSSVIKVFDMTIATTGVNEKTAKQAGIDCDKVYLSPMSHAGYYPGGKVMTLKVVFEKGTYRLLGAQIVGYEGVDKRIDVLATAIHAGLSALQLKDLDLAYAPPYSSAKDPVNMAGFMIENLSHGLVEQFFPEDVDALPRDGSVTLLDVRTPGEYADGHAEGFVNLPVDDLRERLREVPVGKPVYVICQSGLRSYIACRILAQQGFKCYNLSGGWRLYETVVRDRTAAQEAWPLRDGEVNRKTQATRCLCSGWLHPLFVSAVGRVLICGLLRVCGVRRPLLPQGRQNAQEHRPAHIEVLKPLIAAAGVEQVNGRGDRHSETPRRRSTAAVHRPSPQPKGPVRSKGIL